MGLCLACMPIGVVRKLACTYSGMVRVPTHGGAARMLACGNGGLQASSSAQVSCPGSWMTKYRSKRPMIVRRRACVACARLNWYTTTFGSGVGRRPLILGVRRRLVCVQVLLPTLRHSPRCVSRTFQWYIAVTKSSLSTSPSARAATTVASMPLNHRGAVAGKVPHGEKWP